MSLCLGSELRFEILLPSDHPSSLPPSLHLSLSLLSFLSPSISFSTSFLLLLLLLLLLTVSGVQLCCSRHRQHGGALSLWQPTPEGDVAEAIAGWEDSIMFWNDRYSFPPSLSHTHTHTHTHTHSPYLSLSLSLTLLLSLL